MRWKSFLWVWQWDQMFSPGEGWWRVPVAGPFPSSAGRCLSLGLVNCPADWWRTGVEAEIRIHLLSVEMITARPCSWWTLLSCVLSPWQTSLLPSFPIGIFPADRNAAQNVYFNHRWCSPSEHRPEIKEKFRDGVPFLSCHFLVLWFFFKASYSNWTNANFFICKMGMIMPTWSWYSRPLRYLKRAPEWDSASCGCGTGKLVTHVDEAWFFLKVEKQKFSGVPRKQVERNRSWLGAGAVMLFVTFPVPWFDLGHSGQGLEPSIYKR